MQIKHHEPTMLHRLFNYAPILPSATRWSGTLKMLKRFFAIRQEYIEVSETEGLSLSVAKTNAFLYYCMNLIKNLDEISVQIQRKGVPLEECRCKIDTLTNRIENQRDNNMARLYGCTLEVVHMKLYS